MCCGVSEGADCVHNNDQCRLWERLLDLYALCIPWI